MKKTLMGVLSAGILVILLIRLTTGIEALLGDSEEAAGNCLTAGSPALWMQTSQADFEKGLLGNVDVSSSPDNVKLSSVTGTAVVTSDNTEVHTDSQSYLLVKTLFFNKSGSTHNNLRIDTDLRASKWNNAAASLRLKINMNTFTHITESTSYVRFSDQIDFSSYADGSYTIELYLKISKNNVSAFNSLFEIYTTLNSYTSSGIIASQVLNSGFTGSKWNALFWVDTVPENTHITFEVRASNIIFAKDDETLSWMSTGANSPQLSGLPVGRFKQWRATLTTGDNEISPILKEVRLYYYP
jgi:hypothetical protein